jgi:putative OPT family oligopeptide transporter
MVELSLRGVILAIFLTILLAISNAYLALKLGILTSASIPAAMISMGILRFFKNSSILENNAVQTAASAGEAVAGGIVYTIPALIIIGYWHNFDYWTNFFIAASGGVLGVLFSIPLRKILVHDPILRFPEGRAIAEVLQLSTEKIGLRDMVHAGILGSGLEFLQSGLKLVASSWSKSFAVQRTLFSVGIGFSATMIGAGYLIGFDMACSILLGALIAWGVVLPLSSHVFVNYLLHTDATNAVTSLWNSELRYVGIGAMLCAGIWTFLQLFKPLCRSISHSLSLKSQTSIARIDQDLPTPYIVVGMCLVTIVLYQLFNNIFPMVFMGESFAFKIVTGSIIYVLFFGGLFAIITAYFSGMVGVSASPGSSVVIAGILFAGWLLSKGLGIWTKLPLTADQIAAAEAVVIIVGSVVTGIAAIANDNTQDLKVGQLVGATPWRQQIMLLLGVIVSALVIPPVMQALFNVYGIAGVMPHPDMDVSQSLPAPVAAMLAAMTITVFQNALPWTMMFIGAAIVVSLLLLAKLFKTHRYFQLSVLGVAIGMYLPLSSSVPLFIGGLIAYMVQRKLKTLPFAEHALRVNSGIRIACGLIAGSAIMDVVLALIFSWQHNQDILRVVGDNWTNYSVGLGFGALIFLWLWIMKRS